MLALDAAGSGCSAAVAAGDRVLASREVGGLHGQAEVLMSLIDGVARDAGVAPAELDLIATTVGPGSFTGIRVGLAAARGIALATQTRLLGVTCFEAVAAAAALTCDDAPLFLVVLESRREELFVQLFDRLASPLGSPSAVRPADLAAMVQAAIGEAPLLVAGDAAHRAAPLLAMQQSTARLEASVPVATGALHAALRRLRLGESETPARPLYLRPPSVTFPKQLRG